MIESYSIKDIESLNTIIEEIMQGLPEKIENAGAEIEDTLLCRSIQSATKIIHELANSFEDFVCMNFI